MKKEYGLGEELHGGKKMADPKTGHFRLSKKRMIYRYF